MTNESPKAQPAPNRGLMALNPKQFKQREQAEQLVCAVCGQIPINEWEPLELQCKHLFCWGCLKDALAKEKCCPSCHREAAVSDVQVSKKANKAIANLMLLVALTEDEQGNVDSISMPLSMMREIQYMQQCTSGGCCPARMSEYPVRVHKPSIPDAVGLESAHPSPGKRQRISKKAKNGLKSPKLEDLSHERMDHERVLSTDEVESGCSGSQGHSGLTKLEFHRSLASGFEHSSRQFERHLQGCVDQLGQEYVGNLIKSSHEQLSKAMTLVNSTKAERNSGASGGVAALAAVAHELLSPGTAQHVLN